MKLENSISDICFQMNLYGGSFVRSLVRPIQLADDENRKALIAAFPLIFERYDAMATASNQERADRIERNSLDSKACKDG